MIGPPPLSGQGANPEITAWAPALIADFYPLVGPFGRPCKEHVMTSRQRSKWAGWLAGMGCLLMVLSATLVRAEEPKARLSAVGAAQVPLAGGGLEHGSVGDTPATSRHRGEDFPRSFVPPAGMYVNVSVPADEFPRPRATLCVDDDGACASCYTSIQAAIDAAGPGDTINVYPGNYNETASNRGILGAAPPGGGQYQFGLFLPYDKPGLTIRGVDCSGTPINNASAVQAHITTNATNSFGYSGTFIEADNVTITGLDFGDNFPETNKTIELIGDNATFKYCQFTDFDNVWLYGGSFYINDWRVNDNGTPANFADDIAHVQSYTIESCDFQLGVSVDIASGAGASGPVAGRKIINNTFDLDGQDYNGISFNGAAGACVPWFTYAVGGAVITGNTFENGILQYIRARGFYDNSQFDWATYWSGNTFDRATASLITVSPFVPRDYAYSCFTNVRRIGSTIQGEIDTSASAGDTVYVKASTFDYNEDVLLNKSLTLLGQGAGLTTLRGPIGGGGSTVQITASNATVAGLTITRAGNTLADWNNTGLNSAAVAIQGLAVANATIRDNLITQCRTGIDINNSNGHTVRNNDIIDNRTGMILRNQTDNLTIVENNIANNWTVGVLFLDASGGSNVPVQTAVNCTISNNNLSGNWYGQICDRQTGGSLPAAGTNLKNFSGNWWGTTMPVITNANSTEPGYAALIPVAFGGAAVPPGGQPDICGAASANFDITPYLNSGTDTNVETTLGRGTFGFQGSYADITVTSQLAQTGAAGRIEEGVNTAGNGGTVHILGGTYSGNVSTAGKSVVLAPGASPAQVTINGNLTLDNNDTLNIELNGATPGTQYDQLVVNGGVSLGGATLNVTTGYTPANNTLFTIINNDGADPVSGIFAGLPEGAVFYVSGKPYKISYVGGSGNDVTLLAQAAGTLEIVYDKSCYKPGETLTATVRMKGLSAPAAGFQAFLAYNSSRLAFTSTPPTPAIYTPAPFGLPVLNTSALVNPSSGILNLASGINQLGGQSPSSADADLAILKFTVMGADACSIGGLVTFRSHTPPTRLTDINGQELAVLTTVDGPAITIDGTAPTITFCPANVTIQCHESTEPGIPFGVASGGVMIYYNLTGPEASAHQAYLKGQFSYGNTNGSQFTFDPSPLTGFGPLTWPLLFGQVPPPSQFGFDFVLPALTNDSSVPTPVLNSYNNTNNSAAGRALAGPVVWKIGDYKDNAPNGPANASNVDINSMIKSPSPGNPATDLQITTFNLSQAGPIFTAQVAGKLVSDGLIHWYNPATPDSPMANFGLDGEFFFSGTLTYDSTGDDGSDRKDFYAGNITISANSPNTALGFARATDGCTQFPTITYTDVANLSGCNGTGTITRTWKATDCAGNESTCVQIITVTDTTPPVISCPPAAPIQCAELIPAPYANLTAFISAGGTASDNCTAVAGLTLSHLGDGALAGGSCGGTITRTYQVTDACGNFSTCTQVFTVHDTTAPAATSSGSVAACYPDVASAEAAALALSSATDNCVGPLTSHVSTSGTCAAVVSVHFTDTCGNPSNTLTFNTRIDNTPPVITCPANVVVTPPINSCTAVGVDPGMATATDNCPGAIAIVSARSDSLPLTDPYPQGVTSILWTATDTCGNSSNCTQTVTVNGSTINVTVELSPTILPLPVTRCITFEVWDCSGPTMQTTSIPMTFVDGGGGKAIATGTICVPINTPTCVTARDKLHTLRSTVLPTGAPPTFAASFTGKRADEPGAIPMVDVGHRLVGGNLNDDIFIDILDFGTWAGLYLTNYGNGDTTCSTLSPHGDISGDGDVGIGDYSFIAINFLMVAENNCCSLAPFMAGGGDDESPTPRDGNGPRASITVAELNQLGLSHLVAGDVNHDGVLDQRDMAAVLSGQMPTPVVNETRGGDGLLPTPIPAEGTPSIRPRRPRG